MTGYRIGYAFADAGIIDQMLKVHDALVVCAPAISQKAIIGALKDKKNSQRSVEEIVEKMDENRKLICKELDRMNDVFEYQKPKGAYYIMARYKFPKIDSFKMAVKILNEARVIVIPGAAFGPTGEGYLRFSFAGESQNIEKGFKRLKKWFDCYK